MPTTTDPGYCIATFPGTIVDQAKSLFRRRDTDAARLFIKLNTDTPYVVPGQMMIIASPENSNQTIQLQHLRRAKNKVNDSMRFIDGDTALFLAENHDRIDKILALSSKGIEYTTEYGTRYFEQINTTLKKIEKLYQDESKSTGKIGSQQFFTQRTILFSELKALISRPVLNKIVPTTIKMQPYLKLSRALGLSTRSIVHQWTTAGAAGAIKGYAERLEASTKAAKIFKSGGYITFGLGLMMTTNDVVLACMNGRENECKKAMLVNYMGFGASTFGARSGGQLGAAAAESLCIGAGLATGGVGLAVCLGTGALAGGIAGGYIGEKMGKGFGGAIGNVIIE